MPEIIEVLEGLLAEEFRFRATGNYLVLQELGQTDYKLGVGVPHFAVRLDLPRLKNERDAAFPFLRSDVAHLNCKCDLIVFVPRQGKTPLVLLIELKMLTERHYLLQLRSSREFVRYLMGLMKLHGLGEIEPEFKGVLIKSRRIPAKSTTRHASLRFERKNDLDVCEWDRSRPMSLAELVQAIG